MEAYQQALELQERACCEYGSLWLLAGRLSFRKSWAMQVPLSSALRKLQTEPK